MQLRLFLITASLQILPLTIPMLVIMNRLAALSGSGILMVVVPLLESFTLTVAKLTMLLLLRVALQIYMVEQSLLEGTVRMI